MFSRIVKAIKWLKTEINKDQHYVSTPPPVKGEPRWVTKTHAMQEMDFRTGKRNDGRDNKEGQ